MLLAIQADLVFLFLVVPAMSHLPMVVDPAMSHLVDLADLADLAESQAKS